MTLQEAAEKLQAEIKAPFVKVTASNNLCDSVHITWSMTPKEEWAHNIFENGKSGKFSIFLANARGSHVQWEKNSDGNATFSVGYNRSDKKIRNIKKPMPLDQLVEKVIKMFN